MTACRTFRLRVAPCDFPLHPSTAGCTLRLPVAAHDRLLHPATGCCSAQLPAAAHACLLQPTTIPCILHCLLQPTTIRCILHCPLHLIAACYNTRSAAKRSHVTLHQALVRSHYTRRSSASRCMEPMRTAHARPALRLPAADDLHHRHHRDGSDCAHGVHCDGTRHLHRDPGRSDRHHDPVRGRVHDRRHGQDHDPVGPAERPVRRPAHPRRRLHVQGAVRDRHARCDDVHGRADGHRGRDGPAAYVPGRSLSASVAAAVAVRSGAARCRWLCAAARSRSMPRRTS